ncbi:MAG TPA: hypothetical protein PKM41_01530 [Deltaproteobacteria bacterium]|jgi:hypothetical protein|nr:hypothetical protein [Deltaproteobacteria bacterium]HOI07040.1 hypothetical protein [Deltaproteobacteria bacterium]
MPVHENIGRKWLQRLPLSALAVSMLCALAFPVPASGHPPKDVSLAFDTQKGVLAVTITHSSFFPSKHYIKDVVISVNGKQVGGTPYTVQPAGDSFTYTYPVQASPGDVISVIATCNIFGSKEGSVTVPR